MTIDKWLNKWRRKTDKENPNELRKWFGNRISADLWWAKDSIEKTQWLMDWWWKLVEEIKESIYRLLEDTEVKDFIRRKGDLWILDWLNQLESFFDELNITSEKAKKSLKKASDRVIQWISFVETIQWANIRDALTWVFNRQLIEMEMDRLLSCWKKFWIIYIDIDNFKPFNDKFSHSVWDECLKHLVKVLFSIFWDTNNNHAFNNSIDKVCRLWWDEFLIICCKENVFIKKSVELIQTILSNPSWKFKFSYNWVEYIEEVHVSIWYAEVRPNESKEDFLERADLLMKANKNK